MNLAYWTVTNSIKSITRMICKVDAEQLDHVPQQGPLLLVCNHVNFLDAPVVYTHLAPRPIAGFAKAETWENPWMGKLFDLWGAIPIRRGEADTVAMRQGLEALSAGKILAVAPEGTRSGDGCLQHGHAGIITLALRSKAPLLPLVYYGSEQYREHFKRLQRPEFHIRVGTPFRLKMARHGLTRLIRDQMVDEVMYQLAALLPPVYRGIYADLSQASTDFLEFIGDQ